MAPRVLCVVGPTASGKTKMAVSLARRFGGEVVSVDSMQIYRGMTIGTAAPTARRRTAASGTFWPGGGCRCWPEARGCIWTP